MTSFVATMFCLFLFNSFWSVRQFVNNTAPMDFAGGLAWAAQIGFTIWAGTLLWSR